jgi:hypothetical protein
MKHRHVSISTAVLQELRQIGRRLKQQGRIADFVGSATAIDRGLATQPLPPATGPAVFGCPLYHLPHVQILVCAAAGAPISAVFGVVVPLAQTNGNALPPVFVMRFNAMD